MAVNRAGQGDYQQMERLYDVGHYTNRFSVILPDNNIIRSGRIFAPYELTIFRALFLLVLLVVPRKTGPDLFQIHVLLVQQHLTEDPPVSVTFAPSYGLKISVCS